jgi:hypothetical protein
MGWQQDTPLGVTALFLSAATVATLALYNRKYKVSVLLLGPQLLQDACAELPLFV